MERAIWRRTAAALKSIPPTRPRNAVYTDREVVAVYLWAALHDRPVSWACKRSNWPPQAWRRRLPDQSTMSRRLRRPTVLALVRRLLHVLQRESPPADVLLIDGKALEVSEYSRDPDARRGYGVRGFAKGYRLHALVTQEWQLLAWRVRPLNEAECTVAQGLLRDAVRASPHLRSSGALIIGDPSYDSNRLHLRASTLGLNLIAQRRKPKKGVSKWRPHHRSRLRSISVTEGSGSPRRLRWLKRQRVAVEHFFGALASVGGGLSHLPAWARRKHRVELWVGAKVALNAARIQLRGGVAA